MLEYKKYKPVAVFIAVLWLPVVVIWVTAAVLIFGPALALFAWMQHKTASAHPK